MTRSLEELLMIDCSLFTLLGFAFLWMMEEGLSSLGGSEMLRLRSSCQEGSELRGRGRELAAGRCFFLEEEEVRL